MQILIVDNDDKKIGNIKNFLMTTLLVDEVNIFCARYINEFNEIIQTVAFDVIILDLRMQFMKGGDERHTGLEAIKLLESCSKQKSAQVVALTAYEELLSEHRISYDEQGVLLLQYDHSETWKSGLENTLRRLQISLHYKFVILCALDDEMNAFSETKLQIGETKFVYGLNLTEVSLGTHKGAIVVFSEMGIAITSVITTRILENFIPEVICMSGICAGFPKNTQLGQVVVADPCWDYQSGKITNDGMKLAAYQVRLGDNVKTTLEVLSKKTNLKTVLHENLDQLENTPSKVCCIAPFVTGSPVVANEDIMSSILKQHRKVAALDMEVYGFYRAVKYSCSKAKYFAAKCVVDLGSKEKGDSVRSDSCIIAARYTVEAVSELLR